MIAGTPYPTTESLSTTHQRHCVIDQDVGILGPDEDLSEGRQVRCGRRKYGSLEMGKQGLAVVSMASVSGGAARRF